MISVGWRNQPILLDKYYNWFTILTTIDNIALILLYITNKYKRKRNHSIEMASSSNYGYPASLPQGIGYSLKNLVSRYRFSIHLEDFTQRKLSNTSQVVVNIYEKLWRRPKRSLMERAVRFISYAAIQIMTPYPKVRKLQVTNETLDMSRTWPKISRG